MVLDLLKYKPGGGEVPDEEYRAIHDRLIEPERWIVDGCGSWETVWTRLQAADTRLDLDRPLFLHYWWVTKRFLKGLLVPPESRPENSPLLRGTLNSYYTVWLGNKKLTPKYRESVKQAEGTNRVYHLKSPDDVEKFYRHIEGGLAKE